MSVDSHESEKQRVDLTNTLNSAKDSISIAFQETETTSTCSTKDAASDKPKKIGRLPPEHVPFTLKQSLKELEKFYTVSVNPLRKSGNFAESTLEKFLERVSCFLNYCRVTRPDKEVSLEAINDSKLVEMYIIYQHDRGLNVSTVVCTLTVLVNLAKYVHRLCPDVSSCPEIAYLWNIQMYLEEKGYILAVKAGLAQQRGKVSKNLEFANVLEALRKLREKVDMSRGEPNHVRFLHDFVLLGLYLTCM